MPSIDTRDNGYPAELRTDRRASKVSARAGSRTIRSSFARHLPHADRDMDLAPELAAINCPVLVTAANSIAAGRRARRAGREGDPGRDFKVLPAGTMRACRRRS